MDLLLLGASRGKTELIEGRVYRRALAPSPSEARGIFKSLARELCAYYGVEWRKRYIENKTTFDIERAHLRLDGTQVELSIDVPPSVWQAFA